MLARSAGGPTHFVTLCLRETLYSQDSMTPTELAEYSASTDYEIVQRVLAGEVGLYEVLIRRYDRRLYRITRAILRTGQEAEDVVQEAYVRAYEHLAQYEGRALFSTWLTKIAVYEAWNR